MIEQTEVEELVYNLRHRASIYEPCISSDLMRKAASAIDELHEVNKWYKYCLDKAEHADVLRAGNA